MAPPFRVVGVPSEWFEIEFSPRAEPLPSAERKSFSEEVLYVALSFSAYHLLASFFGDHEQNAAPRYSDDWWKGQALLTSFLVYARQVDDFIYPEIAAHPKKPDSDGVRRIDLGSPENRNTITSFDMVADATEWFESRPARDRNLTTVRRRINRSVVHLDRSRRSRRADLGPEHDPSRKRQVWTPDEIWNALRPGLKAFRGCVPDHNLCEGFRFHLDQAIEARATDLESLDSFPYFPDGGETP